MNVDAIMTSRLVTVNAEASVAEVRRLFNEHSFHHLLVLDAGRLRGVITDRDLLANLSPFVGKATERSQDHFLLDRRAHQIMSRSYVAVQPGVPVKDALARMLEHGASCAVVCDGGDKPRGIVTWHDFLKHALACGLEPAAPPAASVPPIARAA